MNVMSTVPHGLICFKNATTRGKIRNPGLGSILNVSGMPLPHLLRFLHDSWNMISTGTVTKNLVQHSLRHIPISDFCTILI